MHRGWGEVNFRHLVSEAAWNDLLHRGQRRRYTRAAWLFHQGESPDFVVALTDGIVKITQLTKGGTVAPLALRGPGEVLGEIGALLNKPRSASVKAVSECIGYVLPAHAFRGYINRHDLNSAVYQLAIQRMHENEQLRSALTRLPPQARVAQVIRYLAAEIGERGDDGIVTLQLGMSRDELATMASMSRSSAMAVLRTFHDAHVLDLGRERLAVRDSAALAELADG
ncbi:MULTISPECIES: Crp/Fnr family transcriptional regulator [Streptomyces]|uniref:Crp/Fnr family transcriptional regulator n=1 Tax=Streptomyces TaxID=1883 RepID=UPI000995FE31|nr:MULTISPECIES: Crp/Fnr family transcriptional regulator [Streptomyces]QDA05957.1 Crp/Fnr family transcriptional regulator [Streptomyces rimosus]QEV77231.1 Crp/Fnr family transcriptional regulator [Streptomyces rimosus]QGY65092.1 cyclic nucleotide-binding domain-containing protein [Streptomyces rimosus R6-500]QTL88067.1 Crp/Fnr family transcriptional regulator [Streptomyces rimosus subsp. rimosus]